MAIVYKNDNILSAAYSNTEIVKIYKGDDLFLEETIEGCNYITGTTVDDTPLTITVNDKAYEVTPTNNKFKFIFNDDVVSMYYLFYNCTTVVTLDFTHWDVSNATNMRSAFNQCTELLEINGTENWNTSNVTNMRCLFYNCKKLTNLEDIITHLDVSSVTDMSYMFYQCNATNLDFSGWDTSNVTNMSEMFRGSYFTNLDLTNFDTSNVTNMTEMFRDCTKLVSLDVSNFDTSKVTTMYSMFYHCDSLKKLDLSKWDTSKVTSMHYMFFNCQVLQVDISNFNTSRVTDMMYAFNSTDITKIKGINDLDTSRVTSMSSTFSNCTKNTRILDLSKLNTNRVTDAYCIFNNCYASTLYLDKFNFSKYTNLGLIFYGDCYVKHIRCNQAFKDWCIANQDVIGLPNTLREGGSGTWEIID